MKIYRIAKQKYLEDLSGEGARLFGGRWNTRGYCMLYFSETLTLCVLEILVHLDYTFLNKDFGFLEVEIPDELIKPKIKISKLESYWRDNPPSIYTQNFGTTWLKSQKSLAMQVPFPILPIANNILINPKHKNSSEIKIIKIGNLDLDSRVFN